MHPVDLRPPWLLRHLGETRTPRTRQPKLIQNLLLGDLLGAPEDVDLAEIGEPELVQMHLRPERDEADERVLRQERDGLPHGHLDVLELLLDDAGVDHEEEYRGRRRGRAALVEGHAGGRGGAGEEVLDGGALREELGGDVGLGDGGVVGREVVAGEAERADPDLGSEVDAGEGVEEGRAGGLAAERRVRERRRGERLGRADRGDRGGERHDAAARLHLGARPGVPGEADGVRAVRVRAAAAAAEDRPPWRVGAVARRAAVGEVVGMGSEQIGGGARGVCLSSRSRRVAAFALLEAWLVSFRFVFIFLFECAFDSDGRGGEPAKLACDGWMRFVATCRLGEVSPRRMMCSVSVSDCGSYTM